jgi:hypothetical protein
MSTNCAQPDITIHKVQEPPNLSRSMNIGPARLTGKYQRATDWLSEEA